MFGLAGWGDGIVGAGMAKNCILVTHSLLQKTVAAEKYNLKENTYNKICDATPKITFSKMGKPSLLLSK